MNQTDKNQFLIDTAAKTLTKSFRKLEKISVNNWQWFEDSSEARKSFRKAARRYAERFVELHNHLPIIGTDLTGDLENLSYRLNLPGKTDSFGWLSGGEIGEEGIWETAGENQEEVEGVDALGLVSRNQYLMIMGEPGSGKTAFFKYLGLQALVGNLEKIPVFVSLKELAEGDQGLLDFITGQFQTCGFPETGLFVAEQLDRGGFLLLLDGLNELGKAGFVKLAEEVNHLCQRYSKTNCFISCRTTAYNYNFHRFSEALLVGLSEEEIRDFITKWFGKKKAKARNCWERLEAGRAIRELVKSPLNLAFYCFSFDEDMEAPANRTELYEDAVRTFLRKRGDNPRPGGLSSRFSTRRQEEMLSQAACLNFKKEKEAVRYKKLERQLTGFIENFSRLSGKEIKKESKAVLKAACIQSGLMEERSGLYAFVHLVLQEYFTARYVVDNAVKDTIPLMIKRLTDQRWREVFILCAQMLPEADSLLGIMKKKADSSVIHHGLKRLLQLVKEAVSAVKMEYRLSAGNSFYVTLDRAHGLGFITGYDLALARAMALGRMLAPDQEGNLTVFRIHDLISELDRSRNLVSAPASSRKVSLSSLAKSLEEPIEKILLSNTPKQDRNQPAGSKGKWLSRMSRKQETARRIELDREQIDGLNDYLYANHLILTCLHCQSYVPPSVRDEISSGFLLPQNL